MTHRVAVNLTWVAPGRVGGSEEYLVRQLTGLDDAEFAPELFCTAAFRDAHPRLMGRYPVRVSPLRRDRRALRVAAEHTWLAAATRGVDVVHHGGGTAPLIGRRPIVLTVHDLQYREFPQYFGRGRRRYLDAMMPRSVRRAAVIAVPTTFVRDTVIEAFGADADRVVVVPHGVPDVEVAPERIAEARRAHVGGERPFVVYPAITHPHKGHTLLVDMLDHLPSAGDGDDLMVVLIGGEGGAEAALRSSIASSPYRDRIVRPGRVSADDRDALVAGSEALVFPSEYEGFGAPLVEAMSAGVPVVCSDAAALTEVAGDAAEVVTDRTGAAWAEAVTRARSRRGELAEQGLARRRRFDLAASGAALADAYRLAVEVGA